jgi:RNA polymerase sigma factor (sigma-70 family)
MRVVLRHLVIDRLRRGRVSRVGASDGITEVSIEPEPAPWWHEIDVGAVERELSSLSPPLRDTFRMFAFEARSYKQIAERLNIAVGTVGVRISRARALLKQRLIERGASSLPGHAHAVG